MKKLLLLVTSLTLIQISAAEKELAYVAKQVEPGPKATGTSKSVETEHPEQRLPRTSDWPIDPQGGKLTRDPARLRAAGILPPF